jgi:hypothetical protein
MEGDPGDQPAGDAEFDDALDGLTEQNRPGGLVAGRSGLEVVVQLFPVVLVELGIGRKHVVDQVVDRLVELAVIDRVGVVFEPGRLDVAVGGLGFDRLDRLRRRAVHVKAEAIGCVMASSVLTLAAAPEKAKGRVSPAPRRQADEAARRSRLLRYSVPPPARPRSRRIDPGARAEQPNVNATRP